MRLKRIILALAMVCAGVYTQAQTDTIRYVRTSDKGGAFNNDGKSWATAKDKVQDAINDLRDYLLANPGVKSGSVYIAAGNYVPTESTEAAGGSMLNTSFKIYAGIHVYGGFNPDDPEEKPGDRIMSNGKKCSENWADPSGIGTTSGTEIASQWDLRYKTVLSGNHTSTPPTFVFDSIRGRYNTAYSASSYHVVWFATNGVYESSNDSTKGHYRGLARPASLDGCVISSGAASTRNTQAREHTAYGGGVYMVDSATLRNCIVERCIATMRGGGIYADGGGTIEFCFVECCQATGVGVLEGYGGGVCIDYAGSIGHSHITSCAARCGGGLLISHIPEEYPTTGVTAIDTISNYSPFAAACVINNNTANAEGGGVYLAEGGTINHCTVTGNNCSGPDVTYYGRRHGRTGGIYVRNCGMIFNSVFWGNRCDANNDIQFASVRQKIRSGYETLCFHTAFMNHDISDWTGVRKEQVFALEKQNLPVNSTLGNHPCFFRPTVDPTNWNRYDPGNGYYGAGVFMHLYPVQIPGPRIWHLTSYSALDQKGVQANETMTNVSYWLRHAHTDYGVVSNPYEPVATLGALVRRSDPLSYALVVPQGYEGRVGPNKDTPIPTLFIDPNRQGVYDEDGHFVEQTKEGNSWTTPIKDLGEAISFFRQFLVDDPGDSHHFMIPALDGDGMPTGDKVRYDYIQFLVKEGTITTVGHGNYLDRNIRTAAIRLDSHMRLYGGYPASLTDTDTSDRNPRKYKTIITANITGIEGAAGYRNNSAHVIAMVNVEHSIVDGFTLTGANTHNVYFSQSANAGGGLLLNNSSTPAEKRIHMVGNQLRNCVISNCTSPKGAAVYVNGEWNKDDGELCFAELMLQNCVIRNNKADYTEHDDEIEDHGVITANGRAYIHVEHCTVVNNVGFPFKADSKTTEGDLPIHCGHHAHQSYAPFHGYIRVDNSLIFCNGDRVLDNRGDLGEVAYVMSVNSDGQDYVFGKWNMFDADLRLHNADIHQPRGFFANDFAIPDTVHFLPAGVESHFAADIFDIPADSLTRGNRCIFTRNSTDSSYPTFVNPSRNVGNSETGDKPLYGGVVAYDPLTTNPCVNAAHPDDYTEHDNYDRSDNLRRDRGGAPDIGAVENADLPAAGAVIYVTPEGAGKRDGSSWDNAIAGNTVYRLYSAPAADGDSIDAASGARLINKSSGAPVLTTDNRYCGGYAMKYVYPIFYDYGKSYTRDLEINAYIGGVNDGKTDTLSNTTTSTTNLPQRKYNNGTIPTELIPSTAYNTEFPYGELSGNSRYMYRAQGNYSPVTEDGSSLMYQTEGMTTVPGNAASIVKTGHLTVTNERKENYVSGLQYAVEQASARNKTLHENTVQVWVGAGKYSDYKGFIMRDSVSVLGGFPAGKFQAPALSERRALMSKVVEIPKSKENKDLDPADYESILQISDVNPRSGTGTSAVINTAAIKYYDTGQSLKLYINYNTSKYTDNNTIHYYRWDEGEGDYVLERTVDTVVNSSSVKRTSSSELYGSTTKTRNYLRKRVLEMPDVTNTVYAYGLSKGDPGNNDRGKYGDALSHYERVIKEGRLSNVKSTGGTVNGRHQDPNYKEYNEVYWDGFTIRHGFLTNAHHTHGGGAGVSMYEGAHLVNCIVTDNFVGCRGAKGGGVFIDGCTSTIENCFILNNTLTKGQHNEQKQQQGAGLFLYEGTCFNSLMGNNWANGPGAGVAVCVGKFYNNTLAYNTSNNGVGGLRICTGSEPALFMANTIVYGNSGLAIDITDGNAAVAPFINCYIQSATNITKANFLNAINEHTEGVKDGYFGRNNTFLNQKNPTKDNTPFGADIDGSGNYTGNAKTTNNYALRLAETVKCVNSGEEDFEGAMYAAVRAYLQRNNASLNPSDADIKKETFYKNVIGVELPKNDVVYARRVQDCQVDIGAYEFNAAYNIKPDTTTHPGRAIFYIAYDSPGGDASACSPANAACGQKLQLVLDAAGRYKYSLMTSTFYNKGTEGVYAADQPNKHWTVEVWMLGDSAMSTISNSYSEPYTPTRSTKHSIPGYQDNTLDYSFIIPHGVQVKGGYKTGYYHYENAAGEEVEAGTEGAHIVDDRDPLTWRTVLSGMVVSSTGAAGQTFHVVTFTNSLFDTDENLYTEDDGGTERPILDQLAILTDEKDRAVVDGLFIEDGFANSPDPEDQIGAGAVVTEYAHVRNCVVMNNQALEKGGGLYLKPFALVSGTIIKRNSAKVGGGMYIEAPASHNVDSLAHVFTSTICENTASASAGGMWFDNSYARVNSTVLWHNMASDNANVSGSFSRSSAETDYPFNFSAVESRRLEGQGNLELSPTETEGVRWDREDPFNSILYYPIEMSSTLARAGMTYSEWKKTMNIYTTLDSVDIAGVCRAQWTSDGKGRPRGFAWDTDTLVTKNNDMIEIGARAINKSYAINVDKRYVMRRLYVMHTDLINSEAARALQDNTATDSVSQMYRQMGSCILNPFHRPGDAFDYIIAARKSDPAKYCNTVFSVFIEAGTYYPYHNAYGEQDEVRNNTFLVPEGIYVIGGIDSRAPGHSYGQHGYYDMFTADSISANGATTVPIGDTGYSIDVASLDSIRQRGRHRPMRDNNQNSVIEPWELERQTIFSGNAVSGESFTHVYHVITMHADSTKVGPQPRMFYRPNPAYLTGEEDKMFLLSDTICRTDTVNFDKECDLSILGRTTEFDGITITGGYANHLDPNDTLRHHYVKKTYFRGGGIFVDGLWTDQLHDGSLPNMTEPAHYNIPIVVENCVFTDNMAGNGGGMYSNGGIYMYGCHFTQNYSQGPMTPLDQRFIPWTAGGCIATNAVCDVANTLFDNNEARRGLYPITVTGADRIPDADARQGFGGVLSVAAKSKMRVVNCHFMKNKAVAYSSIYNFLANNRYKGDATHPRSDSIQIAINTIFWGNEVFNLPNNKLSDLEYKVAPPVESENAFALKYRGSRGAVFHYDPTYVQRYLKLFHEYDSLYNEYAAKNDTFNVKVTDKLAELRTVGDSIEGLYFCSYRPGYGPTGMKPTKEGYLLTEEEQRAFVDPRSKSVRVRRDLNDDLVENLDSLFTFVHGNNNTLINRINTATDGPNFRQPSFVAGIDGYMQNADWLLARMNLTTDQGWGYLRQTVERGVGYYITKYTGTNQYPTAEAALAAAQAAHPGATVEDVYPVRGLPEATFDDVQPEPGALYNFYARRFGSFMSHVSAPLPLGDQQYMTYTRTISNSETAGVMNRISRNPRMGEREVYIDVGMYEYQYVQLDIKGQEIDTMWVATKEKSSQHDGLSWETPTTDLQMAIDMLMSSHNNHDKYICLMGDKEGSISPSNVIDNRLAFVITSTSRQPLMPDSAQADFDYGVNSLNFLGGYSFDVKDAPRDPVNNPTIIEMPDGNRSQRNQLFVVEDMTRQMLQVNWNGEYVSRDSVVIPISFDGITFINPYAVKDRRSDATDFGGQISRRGGAAIYYRWQRRYEGDGNLEPNMNLALHPDSALIDGNKVTLPKLTLSNCVFMDNGSRESDEFAVRSPAVRIDHGGGSTLVVNSLFHSNAGNPIFAQTYSEPDEPEAEYDLPSVPNDVIIVNSTFALNDGHIHLRSANSEVHNSLIWLNDLKNDTTTQLVMGDDVWDKTTNRTKPGIANRMTNNAVWGCFMMPGNDAYGNDSLVTNNNDISGGPGFINPFVTATLDLERRERNFRLNPSAMTMNMADTTLYKNRVFFRVYPDRTGDELYWRRSNGFKSVTITALANDSDLAAKPRLSGRGMERGAYECLVELQRVLYVTPTISAVSAGDGSNWERSFGHGQLQNAIDAAAVYAYLNQAETRENRMAYVFVKGSLGAEETNHIIARDGVVVIGSLPGTFNDTAVAENPETKIFSSAECQRFVNYVRAYSTGVASPNATPTRINSLHIIGDAFTTGFLMEGFVISNPGRQLVSSPLVISNNMSTLRNCLITDNKVVENVPVAYVYNGLLYNNLFYGDSASTIVMVTENGLALNNTIVATDEGVTPLSSEGAADGAVQNNIAINLHSAVSNQHYFAPYLTSETPYELPEYMLTNPSLAYQLHEHSEWINTGTAMASLPAVFDSYKTDKAIDYAHDRDVLGNPRKIGSAVDKGALETWRVEPNRYVVITARTNREGHSTSAETNLNAYLENYGGNYYPHAGSVVYLMDSAAMTMQYTETPDFQDFSNPTQPIVLKPGYILLKPGASFYGNGYGVQFPYLAAEKRFVSQRYSMTAFPFNYNVGNITVTHYDDTEKTFAIQPSPFAFTTYQYNGVARSAKDYVFQTTNSTLWHPVDTLNRTATEGYLMDFGANVDTVLRFTAFAPIGQYAYTETSDDKTVALTQHDNREAGSGTGLNFTRQEDMGWNMKGLPWLVSDYRTDTLLEEGNYLRQMFIPHVLYLMDGAGEYLKDGDNVYSVRSWDRGTKLSMGNAFLTQTATTSAEEEVIFHLPYYARNRKVSRPLLAIARHQKSAVRNQQSAVRNQQGQTSFISDFVTVIPDSLADKTVSYSYGRDAAKWQSAVATPQIYMLDSRRLSRISLLGAAPTEVDIPLGVSIPAGEKMTNDPSSIIFSLPERIAFADYRYVWLIDRQYNRYTNLLEENYEVELEPGTHNQRFALRIGGYPITNEKGQRQYVVFTHEGSLYVRGLIPGDRIDIYSPDGKLLHHAVAGDNEYVRTIGYQTGLVVKVNDQSHKVLAF